MGCLFGFSIRSTAVILRRLTVYNIYSAQMSTAVAKSLTGKVAVVTASTDGIGFAIARRLAQDGAKVVVSSRKQKNVDKAVKELQRDNLDVLGITCHVGIKEDRERIFQEAATKFGGVDILVSNAAVNPVFGSILDCSEESWDKIFDINVKAAFLLVKAVTPYLEKRGGGSIVLVSSIAGFQPMPGLGAYSVSKTALLGLTKALSQQLAPSQIRVNCIAPGVIQTKFSSMIVDTDAIREKILENVPLQRIGEPHEMGGLASFLCSDDASYITGETIVASGGMVSRL